MYGKNILSIEIKLNLKELKLNLQKAEGKLISVNI